MKEDKLKEKVWKIIKEKLGNEKIIGVTIVGSRLWGDSGIKSDIDVAIIYQRNTREILKDTSKIKDIRGKDGEIDYHIMEIGNLIKRYLKGDVNALITILSNKVLSTSHEFVRLRNKAWFDEKLRFYNSIKGIAKSYAKDGNFYKAGRYIQFGITLYSEGKVEFIRQPCDEERYKLLASTLDAVYEDLVESKELYPYIAESSSFLRDNSKEFEDMLVEFRLSSLKGSR